MKTALNEAQTRMCELKEQKQRELAEIEAKKSETMDTLAEAEKALEEATEKMDVEGYAVAEEAKRKAEQALKMYEARYAQIISKTYIGEEESDSIIDSLLAYEKELADSFRALLTEHLGELRTIYEDYSEQIADCESTMSEWQAVIHANHRTFGRMTRRDENGEITDRSRTPILVHPLPFVGCEESVRLGAYLKNERWLEDYE